MVSCKLTGFPTIGSTPIHLLYYNLVFILKTNTNYTLLNILKFLKLNNCVLKNFQFLYMLEKTSILQTTKFNPKIMENNFYFYSNFVYDTKIINFKYFDYTIDSGKFIFKKSFFNNKFAFYIFKKSFNVISEIVFKGLKVLILAKSELLKESLYFYKYVFGLKSYTKNNCIFNINTIKSNSFF